MSSVCPIAISLHSFKPWWCWKCRGHLTSEGTYSMVTVKGLNFILSVEYKPATSQARWDLSSIVEYTQKKGMHLFSLCRNILLCIVPCSLSTFTMILGAILLYPEVRLSVFIIEFNDKDVVIIHFIDEMITASHSPLWQKLHLLHNVYTLRSYRTCVIRLLCAFSTKCPVHSDDPSRFCNISLTVPHFVSIS